MQHLIIDYVMCPDEGFIGDSPDSWEAFIEGYRIVDMDFQNFHLTLLKKSGKLPQAISPD